MASSASPSSGKLVALQIACGSSHTLCLLGKTADGPREDSVVLSWGQGEEGQLGHGDVDERYEPTVVQQISGNTGHHISFVCCGAEHSVATSATMKRTYSWGDGDFGRLGNGELSGLFLPSPVRSLSEIQVKKMVCGDSHCMAIPEGHGIWSWGRNHVGELGLGHTNDVLAPVKIAYFEGKVVRDVACGAEHTVAVLDSGEVFSWGWGTYGCLGLGDRKHRSLPSPVSINLEEGVKIKQVACGWRHSCFVTSDGLLFTAGWAKYGQLGHLLMEDHLYAAKVVALEELKVKLVSGGWRHTVAVTPSGRLFAWGWNKFGQLGLGMHHDVNIPTQVVATADKTITQVACGWRHTVAISDDGGIYSWGRGANGQLGHGDTEEQSLPVRIELIDKICSLGVDALSDREPRQTHRHIPASDRYAVVPDVLDSEVPEVPNIKRARTDQYCP